MKGLTQRQQQVLEFIAAYVNERGYPPTYQEIADALGITSKQGVVRHLEALIRKGYLTKDDTTARSLRIVAPEYQTPLTGAEVVELPLVGRVAAGFPILAEENIEDTVIVPRRLIKSEGRYFVLRVQGDSMVNAGILDGDLVVVQSTPTAAPGSIVVALVGGEVTVKRLVQEGNRRYLKAENPAYPDIVPEEDWQIQGRVVGLIRDTVN